VLVLDEAEDIFQSEYNNPLGRILGKRDGSKSWMNSLLEGNQNPVIWISNRVDQIDAAYLRRFTFCLEFPRTPRGVRRKIAHAHLGPVGCSPEVMDSLASEADVSPAMLASAAQFTRIANLPTNEVDRGVKTVVLQVAKAMGHKLGSKVPDRSTRFDTQYLHVRGPVTADAVLSGLGHLGRGRLLLSGSPGTGKTQFAAEIAQRLGRELVYRTASDINSMWFGESERNVARMFEDCDSQAEVLFLDEADTLMRARDGQAHRAEVAVTAEFLRQVEAFEGVFVCATNFGSLLDAALLRRFEFRLELLPLSVPQKLEMFCEIALGGGVPSGAGQPILETGVATRLSAMDRLTPGDFANVKRRLASLKLEVGAAGWLDELQVEHDSKSGGCASRPIGFI
jgi:SpoVK/Ycf46/Vps4 family AAA+-type ATPase